MDTSLLPDRVAEAVDYAFRYWSRHRYPLAEIEAAIIRLVEQRAFHWETEGDPINPERPFWWKVENTSS